MSLHYVLRLFITQTGKSVGPLEQSFVEGCIGKQWLFFVRGVQCTQPVVKMHRV
jgi:hypothetical protein